MQQLIHVGGATPLLDIGSYARKGPGRRDRLSSAEIELIRRTVNRTPEVMVKVLVRGGQNLKAVRAHLVYLSRGGELETETDDGERLSGKGVEKDLLDDWNLDLEEYRRGSGIGPRANRNPPKLAHKVLFSMPPGTPPDKVLAAVKTFAREEFGAKHRYAMVLHTDEAHPHVHMVVKAISEDGVRLNIRKSTLREWRGQFARHLRDLGVPANATDRSVRGQDRAPKLDGIYRADLRGQSRHIRERAEGIAREPTNADSKLNPGRSRLLETRKEVERGWRAVIEILAKEQPTLSEAVRRFAQQLQPPRTDNERLAAALQAQASKQRQSAGPPIAR
jgi:relaxase-like protein